MCFLGKNLLIRSKNPKIQLHLELLRHYQQTRHKLGYAVTKFNLEQRVWDFLGFYGGTAEISVIVRCTLF